MYELTVEAVFAAAHAIVIRGEREPVHGHNWHVTVAVRGAELDEDGLVVDFHEVERALREVTGRFANRNLNEISPFDEVNPTAEQVARHIGEAMRERVAGLGGAELAWVRVTEAPGCAVTWRAV